MKIVILGNMGYVGPSVVERLRKNYPTANLIGFDTAFFANCFTNTEYFPERNLNQQYFGDVRDIPEEIFWGADAVINLAAISNEPMGARFEKVTREINYKACIKVAAKAKMAGVRSFVLASSCSVYGAGDGTMKNETSLLHPLTEYAASKLNAENDLKKLADENFKVTCLRFGTACGMSSRLRLDLVLNDFVASALVSKEIVIMSDGTPWRPLINIKDMARAFDWAISRSTVSGDFLTVNTGSNDWNFQVKQIAEAVAFVIPGVSVLINTEAVFDNRSYLVDFSLYKTLAPDHQPQFDLLGTIKELEEGLVQFGFKDKQFRSSNLIRLNVLSDLQRRNHLNAELNWNFSNQTILTEQ
jgi:nucleoside-diphosphate-sugar epimerase